MMTHMERTFMMIKPDGVKRRLVGEVIKRVEESGLTILAMKLIKISTELARKHYAAHLHKDFFPKLERFITSGPVVAMVIAGDNAIAQVRKLNGDTNPAKALSGTIRGDFAHDLTHNVVHGSDSIASATSEIQLFFSENEIQSFYTNN